MSNHQDRNPDESIRGSGYFDKSTDSMPSPPPQVVEQQPQTDDSGGTSASGQAAAALLDDFPD
jgi:hypothetical protein